MGFWGNLSKQLAQGALQRRGIYVKPRSPEKQQPKTETGRTNVPGQNTQQNDSPDHDEHHDESRRNQFDPETAEALKPKQKPAGGN